MKYRDTSNMYLRIDDLIRRCATGTPDELCRRLGIPVSTWHDIRRAMMDDFGCPIAYCRYRQTYYYTERGRFEGPRFVREEG